MERKVMVIGSLKAEKRRRPTIRISGFWLSNIGFEPNTMVCIDYGKKGFTMKPCGVGAENYLDAARNMLKNRTGNIVQVKNTVKNKKATPIIEIKGFWLEELGFNIGDVILIQYEENVIDVDVLDVKAMATLFRETRMSV